MVGHAGSALSPPLAQAAASKKVIDGSIPVVDKGLTQADLSMRMVNSRLCWLR